MRCKAGRTPGPADGDFELSRLDGLEQRAAAGGGAEEDGGPSTAAPRHLLPVRQSDVDAARGAAASQ